MLRYFQCAAHVALLCTVSFIVACGSEVANDDDDSEVGEVDAEGEVRDSEVRDSEVVDADLDSDGYRDGERDVSDDEDALDGASDGEVVTSDVGDTSQDADVGDTRDVDTADARDSNPGEEAIDTLDTSDTVQTDETANPNDTATPNDTSSTGDTHADETSTTGDTANANDTATATEIANPTDTAPLESDTTTALETSPLESDVVLEPHDTQVEPGDVLADSSVETREETSEDTNESLPDVATDISNDSSDAGCSGIACACTTGATRVCGSEVGACKLGREPCIAGIWGACDATTPANEQSDDGVDSDCDRSELFAGQSLAVGSTLDAQALHTPISGTFEFAGIGPLAVTGAVTREAAGAPATWCIEAPLTAHFGALTFTSATLELCVPGTIAEISGSATMYGHAVTVAGAYHINTRRLDLTVTTVRAANDPLDWSVTSGTISGKANSLALAVTARRDQLVVDAIAIDGPELHIQGPTPSLTGTTTVRLGDATLDVQVHGSREGEATTLSGRVPGPVTLATGLVVVPYLDVTIDHGLFVAAELQALLPNGWPATSAPVRAQVVNGQADLVGDIAAPYRLGSDFVLSNAKLALHAQPNASTLSLRGDAVLPWDPSGGPLEFVADIVSGVRPLLVANTSQRTFCGVALAAVEVTASLDANAHLTFGESLDGDASLSVEGTTYPVRLEGMAAGADFSLSARLGDVTAMHTVALRNARVEVLCTDGVATRQLRGIHDLLLPDGSEVPLMMVGTLDAAGFVPSLRGALDVADVVEVFAGKVKLKTVIIDATRTATSADFFIEGEERVTLDSLATDIAFRYRGAFVPGHDVNSMDGVPLRDDGGLDLASLELTAATGHLSTVEGRLVREFAGRYDHELPDGDILSAQLTGKIDGLTDTYLHGQILQIGGGDNGVYTFFDEVTLTDAGLEVKLNKVEKTVAVYGNFAFDLDDRPVELAVRGQFSAYSSQAPFSGQKVTLSGNLRGANDTALVEVVPGLFDLSDVTVTVIAQKLKNSSDGQKLAIRLDGRAALTLDDETYNVVVSGELGLAKSTLVNPPPGTKKAIGLAARLEGRIEGDIQPLRSILGDDRAAIINPLVAFDFRLKPSRSVRVIISADAEVCITPDCVLGTGIQMAAAGVFEYVRGGRANGWLRGVVRDVELPGIGNIGTAGFVINTGLLVDFDVLGDNRDIVSESRYWLPTDLVGDNRFNRLPAIEPGVTFVYQHALPFTFPEVDPGEIQFAFGIGPFSAMASAKIPIGLPLIIPEFQIPGIQRFTIIDGRLTLTVGFEGQNVFLALDGRAELLPTKQTLPLVGTVNLRGGVDSLGGSIDAMASVSGRWTEPFGIPGFAFQNPAVAIGVNITSAGTVTPSSIGANADVFLLMRDEWPPEDIDLNGQTASNVIKLGGTFYFDKRRTKSALCLPLDVYCPALPTVIARLEIQNIGLIELPAYLERMLIAVGNMAIDVGEVFAGKILSPELIAELPNQEFDTRINRAILTFSTHDTKVLGQRWSAGLRTALDMDFLGRSITFDGYAWSDAITLDGFAQGMDLWWLDIVGDPYRQYAAPHDGHIEAAADARLDTASGTVEGWVKDDWSTRATLVDRTDADGGYRVTIADPDSNGFARVTFEARRGANVRTTISEPLVRTNARCHIAVAFQGGDAEIFVDGDKADSETTGADADLFVDGPGAGGPLRIGEGLAEIDDVRIWSVIRPRATIRSQSLELPINYQREPTLIARYELDYDNTWTPAHNSRLYAGDATNQMHAVFVAGAEPVREIEGNDLHFTLHIDPLDPGVGFQVGGAFTIPPLGTTPPAEGFDARARFFLDASVTGLTARGNFLLTETGLVPSFHFTEAGKLERDGYYTADGGGPNLVRGDFDDGPYGAFDVTKPEFAASIAIVHSPNSGGRKDVGSGTMSYVCPPGATCSAFAGKEFNAEGEIDIVLPFGTAPVETLPPEKVVRIQGNFLTAPGELSIGGSASDPGRITVFGHVLADGCFYMTSDTRPTVCDDCGNGRVEGAEHCDDGNTLDGDGCSAICKREPLAPVAAWDIKRVGWRGIFDIPQFVHADMAANIVVGGDFSMSGHGRLKAGTFLLSETEFSLDRDGFFAKSDLKIGETTLNLEGEIEADGTFDLKADGSLVIAGMTLADAHVNAYWDGSGGGVTVSGKVDIGIAQVEVTGDIDSTGHVRLTYDGALDIGGWAMSNSHVVITEDGADITGNLQVGAATTAVAGTFDAAGFQLSGNYNVPLGGFSSAATISLSGDHNGVTGSLAANVTADQSTATLAGSISPAGGFRLSGTGTIRFAGRTWAGASVTLNSTDPDAGFSASGALDLSFTQLNARASVNPDGTFRATADSATLAGFATSSVDLVFAVGSLSLSTNVQVLGSSIAMSGNVGAGNVFSLTSATTLSLFGRSLTSASATLNQDGLSLAGHVDFTVANIRLVADLALSQGALRGSGSVSTFGTSIAVDTLVLDGQEMTFNGELDLDVALLVVRTRIAFFVSFVSPTLCGNGQAVVDTALGDYPCDVDVCVGALGPQTSKVECHGRCWSDAPCGDGKFCDGLGNCFAKRPLGETCPGLLVGDHECASGFCDPWAVVGRAVCANTLGEGIGCLQDGQCTSQNCGARPGLLEFRCFNPDTRVVDQECYDPDHCGIGECWGTPGWPSRCLCVNNNDCTNSGFAGQVCNIGSWGVEPGSGLCMAPRTAGQQCDATSECTGGLSCSGGICIAAASRHNFESCQVDAECVSGQCWTGQCRCVTQNDCTVDRGANSYCDEGIWLAGNHEGECHDKWPDAGAPYCESGAWCQSGRCDWSPRQGRNICWSPVPQPYGATCDLNGHCASNSCNGSNTCNPVAYSIPNNVRSYCEDNAWCQAGGSCLYSLAASKKVCVAPATRNWGDACDVDMQCGADPNLGCKYWPIGGAGVGRPDIGIGYYCGF